MKNSQQHLGNEANLATFSLSHHVIFFMVSPLLGRFLVSFNLQSTICGLQSAVCSLRSAVCSLQMSYTALKSDYGDGSENVVKAIGLPVISKTTTLHVHHTFLYISLPFLHDYDVKMPHFMFYTGRK